LWFAEVMTEPKQTWNELGDRLEALGLKLKMHLEQSTDGVLPDALIKLGETVKETFEAAGNAIKDDAVRADVREVGHLLGELVSGTLGKVRRG
jgi:hypothetical protein